MPPQCPDEIYDDGWRIYVVFPGGIVQGRMPPVVVGPVGEAPIVNSRLHQNIPSVDRLC